MDNWRTQKPLLEGGNLIIDGEIVVSQTEEPLQHALADRLCASSDIRLLEVGYGLGLAHNRIRSRRPAEHWVIEGNKWLAGECIDFIPDSHQQSLPIVIADTWEHAIPALPTSYYDSILFDPYPFDELAKGFSSWADKFRFVALGAAGGLFRILRPGGKLGVINFDPRHYDEKWMLDQFSNRFELDVRVNLRELQISEESWILRKPA